MSVRSFSGDFFEIGRQQGKIYARNGMSFNQININQELFQNQLKIYKKYYPDQLTEFQGMAEVGNFDSEKLIYDFICGEILWFGRKFNLKKSCSIFGVRSDNNIFVGRNYDWLPIVEKYMEVYRVINRNRNAFIAISDMGIGSVHDTPANHFFNADDAINDKGLYIGITFAHDDKWSIGLSCIHMTKLIVETCATTKEALKLFKKIPLCCPKNFFIADRIGNMVVVEHNSKKFKIITPKNDILIQTNHFVAPELAKEDKVLDETPDHNTFKRYDELHQKITGIKGSFKQPDCINILGDKNALVCQNSRVTKTIWSLSLDLKNKNYKLYRNLFGKREKLTLSI